MTAGLARWSQSVSTCPRGSRVGMAAGWFRCLYGQKWQKTNMDWEISQESLQNSWEKSMIPPNKPIQWKLHKNIKLYKIGFPIPKKLADGDHQTALILMLRLLALFVKCLLCAARNRPPLSLSKLIKNMENKEGKIAVVVGGRGWERWGAMWHPWITDDHWDDEPWWSPVRAQWT